MGKDADPKLYTESDVRFLKEHVARLLAAIEEQAQRIEELERKRPTNYTLTACSS